MPLMPATSVAQLTTLVNGHTSFFVPGFNAVVAGHVTKKLAASAANEAGLPQSQVTRVHNRFWRGWMVAEVTEDSICVHTKCNLGTVTLPRVTS